MDLTRPLNSGSPARQVFIPEAARQAGFLRPPQTGCESFPALGIDQTQFFERQEDDVKRNCFFT